MGLADLLAPKAEAGERQSTLPGYNAAVWATKYVGWTGPNSRGHTTKRGL